jgi:hypothetical protein
MNSTGMTDGADRGGGMSEEIFLRPRLRGARFDGHAIPLEFLKDLAVLEEMIVEVAKWKFGQENPNRKRSPRGFTEGVQFELTGVENGSVTPVIRIAIAAGTLFSPRPYYEQATDAIVGAISAAKANSKSITNFLPDSALGYFDRIGRSLRDDEAMEFTSSNHQEIASLTRETRRNLVLAASEAKEVTEDTSVRGSVYEADQEKMTFEIQLIDGHKVTGIPMGQHVEVIMMAFNGYRNGDRVLLQGVGKINLQGRIQGFESIEHVSILDPLDVPARLDELRGLKNGWLEGKGKAPNEVGLNWLTQTFEQNFPDGIPLPFVYPTAEGNVQAEWSLESEEITLEIDLESHQAEWHELNLESSMDHSHSLNLNDAKDWERLAGQIRQLAGVQE